MRTVDRLLVEEFHVEITQTMETVGRHIADFTVEHFPEAEHIVVLVGSGHNAGDGLTAVRHLHNKGKNVTAILANENLRGIPFQQLQSVKALGIRIQDSLPQNPDLIVDALLGFGAEGAPRGKTAELIQKALDTKSPVLCVDIPSGLDVTTGKWFEPAFRDAVVLTLGLPKVHMVGNTGIQRLFVIDIGIPRELYEKMGISVPVLFQEREYYQEVVSSQYDELLTTDH